MARYEGNEEAGKSTVGHYLLDNYRWRDGRPLTVDDVDRLIAKGKLEMERGTLMRSNAFYVGDQIAAIEDGLLYIDDEETGADVNDEGSEADV